MKRKLNSGAAIGSVLIGLVALAALGAPWIAPHDPAAVYREALRLPPVWAEGGRQMFLLGTDDLGRCLFSRLIHGARVSLAIGVAVSVLSLSVGTLLGLLAGYFGPWVDWVLMRATDILMALPSILLAIVVVAILGPGVDNTVIAVSVVSVPAFIRIVRAEAMVLRNRPFVLAARMFGLGHIRIMSREILPNCLPSLIVQATFSLSEGVLAAAALGFLGLGAEPPLPEWGVMLADARPWIESAPLMVIFPGLCILTMVMGFNLFGDGLRDMLDPRLKR